MVNMKVSMFSRQYRQRYGESARSMQKDAVVVPPKDAKPAAKKPRIDCIDGCRFALVFPIVVAHFARFRS